MFGLICAKDGVIQANDRGYLIFWSADLGWFR
jgi:hypothetical protein